MSTSRFQRNKSELPGLQQFRRLCVTVAIISATVSFLFVLVRSQQSLRSFALHGALLCGLLAGYFIVIGLRTHAMCWQLSRGSSQTFDRPAPEWITLAFLLAAVGSLIWPL
jgi:hypothetical protein